MRINTISSGLSASRSIPMTGLIRARECLVNEVDNWHILFDADIVCYAAKSEAETVRGEQAVSLD